MLLAIFGNTSKRNAKREWKLAEAFLKLVDNEPSSLNHIFSCVPKRGWQVRPRRDDSLRVGTGYSTTARLELPHRA